MMKKHYFSVLLVLITMNLAIAQTPVIPVSHTTTYTEAFGTLMTNAYNGAGLPAFPALSGDHASIAPDNCFVADAVVGSIDFNLGGNFDIDGIAFWNLNSSPVNCINGVAFYASTDGINFTPITGAPTAFPVVNTGTSPVEMYTFPAVNTNFIRMEVLSSHGDTFIGFSEIAFSEGSTLSLPELSSKNIKLYPNPATDTIQLKGLNENVNYEVYSILGNPVLKGQVGEFDTINISKLQTGVYMIKIEDTTLKFIKR